MTLDEQCEAVRDWQELDAGMIEAIVTQLDKDSYALAMGALGVENRLIVGMHKVTLHAVHTRIGRILSRYHMRGE